MAIKKWIAVDDGGTTKILIDNDPAKASVYEIELLEPDDTAQVATLGNWLDLNDAVTVKGIRNAFYKIEDMAGVEGYADNEQSLVHVDGTGTVYLPKERIFSKAPDALRITLPQERTYSTTATPGATPSLTFGNLNDQDQRDLFMSNANVEQEYSFKVGTLVHRGTVLSKVGDGTNPTDEVIVEGQRLIDGKIQTFKLKVAPTGIENEIYIPMVASGYEFETTKAVSAYTDKDAMPTKAIKQMIDNSIALLPKPLTGNYTSQVDNLKVTESLSDLTPGLKKEYTFPNGFTTDTVGGCEIAMNYTVGGEVRTKSQGFDLRGWDISKPLFLPVTYHSDTTYLWVELKLEAVAGDNTKYSLTNAASGAGANQMDAFGVSAIQFRGGQ